MPTLLSLGGGREADNEQVGNPSVYGLPSHSHDEVRAFLDKSKTISDPRNGTKICLIRINSQPLAPIFSVMVLKLEQF